MHRIARSATVAGIVLLVTSLVATAETDHPRPAALEGSSVTWCGEVSRVTADPSFYRDTPVYLGNPPTSRVRKWAKNQPGFVEVWIDRDNFGWITVGFLHDAAAHQADLERKFPDLGVVAVELPYTNKELKRLQRRLGDAIFPEYASSGSISRGVTNGSVQLFPNIVTEELVAFLEAEFAGEPFCLDGPDPSAVVQPGPQPTEGDGWTLLGAHQAGPPWYRTDVATGPKKLASLWETAGMPGPLPAVDFEEKVVLWFAEPHGSSCSDIRLDDIVIDHDHGLVYPRTVMPDRPRMCTSDLAGAYQFFVAVERDRLPEPPFFVQLDEWDPPGGAPNERTVVEADLRAPGSGPGRDGIHRDRSDPTPAPLRSGGFRERRNDRYELEIDPGCGISYFGELNSVDWVTDVVDVPDAWTEKAANGSVIVRIKMRGGDDPFLDATANGHTVRYLPSRDVPEACIGVGS